MMTYTLDKDANEDEPDKFAAERKRIKAAFDLFDRDGKGIVVKEEVGTMMRYLRAFPTEEEMVTEILPQLQDEEETQFVKIERFEPFMLRILVEKVYEPDPEEVVLEAFKVLDSEGKGYLEEDTIVELLTENEYAFRPKEVQDFLRVAKDTDTGYIHYDDYVAHLAAPVSTSSHK